MSTSPPIRDEAHYIDDGNVVILIENTLFKAHRSSLSRDNSMFQDMFMTVERRKGDMNEEGGSDDNPIPLPGDRAEEFRALMWSLYALPHELMLATTQEANPLQLAHLARITHKYQFRSIEKWALETLIAYLIHPNSPCTHLPELTEVAVLCDQPALLAVITAKWRRLIGEDRELSLAIITAERLNLRPILGLAYHAMMLKGRAVWDADPLLQRTHRIRLLAGHYALTQLCRTLTTRAPELVHDAACVGYRNTNCAGSWVALWSTITSSKDGGLGAQVLNLDDADLLGKVRLAESVVRALVKGDIPANGLLGGITDRCREAALLATIGNSKAIQESVVDCFEDIC